MIFSNIGRSVLYRSSELLGRPAHRPCLVDGAASLSILAAAPSCLLRLLHLLRLQCLQRLLRFRLFLAMSEVSRSLGCVGIDGVSRPSFSTSMKEDSRGIAGCLLQSVLHSRQPCTR